MTAARVPDAAPPLRDRVAEEVRAVLGRRRISGAELARRIGRSQTFVAKRLDGRQAFDIDDLELIASVLEMDPLQFFPRVNNGPSTPGGAGGFPTNPRGNRHLSLVTASGRDEPHVTGPAVA